MGDKGQDQVDGDFGSYTVEHRCGCQIIRGTMTLPDFVALTQQAASENPDSVMALSLARHLDAQFVMGTREAIAALAVETGLGFKPDGLENWPVTDQIHAWLEKARVGRSSETLAWRLLGHTPDPDAGEIANTDIDHPLDADDFGRCITLLDWAPGAREHLTMAEDLSPAWAAIVEHWDELEALAQSENEDAGKRLSDRLRSLTEGAEPSAEAHL